MKFIEMSGTTLYKLAHLDGIRDADLRKAGVTDESIVRVNQQGDIELRRRDRWDVIGGLLGDFEHQIKSATGQEWA